MEEFSIRKLKNEQEGYSKSLSVPDGEVPRCASYFSGNSYGIYDFRGGFPPSSAHLEMLSAEWETSPAETEEEGVFTWIGGSMVRPAMMPAYPYITAKLFVDGVFALEFPLGVADYYSVEENGFTLRFEPRSFISLVEFPHRCWSPDRITGFYHLTIPADKLKKGKPLTLRVGLEKTHRAYETFFFVSPRRDALKVNLAVLHAEVEKLQNDVVMLTASHEMLYAQVYPHLLPNRIKGERIIALQHNTRHFHPPCITRMRNGEVVISMREATDHLVNDGRMILVRSTDGGRTWGEPEVMYDLGRSDHRCGPIFECANGDWVTTDYRAGDFYEKNGLYNGSKAGDPSLWAAWSTDRGKTWTLADKPMTVPGSRLQYCEVERHMIQLKSGRLLVAGAFAYVHPDGKLDFFSVNIAIFSSDDNGRNWQLLSTLPHNPHCIGEPTLLQTGSGRIILIARSEGGFGSRDWNRRGPLFQSVSDDEGKTWSALVETPMSSMSSPGHLLQLQDGRILCSHASRKYPGSIYVTISNDEAETWDVRNTRIVTNDIINFDNCYPTSAQLADGTILTTWYANLFGKFFIPVLRYGPDQL